jgi:Leucine-rich repeat (LRR) protein
MKLNPTIPIPMKKFISLCKKHTSIVFVLLTMNAVAFTQPVSSSDSLALVALYNSTNGPGWTNSTNWLTGPVSTWYGVNVMNNRVWIIDLHDNNLTGNIPYEIGNISNLQYLYLFNNHLTGTIPNTIGNLSNLVNLILSGNHLTSNIPSEIGNLISLQELNIAGNQLNGSIPHEIGNLLNLRSISLMGNQITGSLPAEMGNLINLTTINLSINQLTDSIPSRIGNLSNLDVLMLNNNQLSGNIPNTIWHMANLETLYLQENQLNGELTSEIGSSSKLAVLRLENNRLTGSIPVEIGNLLNLKALMLSSNQFTGTIPDVIWDLTSLSNLSLNDNQLCGTLPADIGNMINLRTLTLGDNQLSGNIPEELSNLSLLELLYISNCSFDGLPVLNNINNLNVLNAENNKLSFEDIEPNIGVANTFTYSPQDMVGEEQNIALSAGDHYTMSVTVGGTHNHYQWYKNSSIIPGASSSSYTISSASSADAGTYECRITNSVATELTLYSRSIHISVQNTGLTIDSLALVALYNSTNGPSWTNRTNWLSGPVSTWYGIGTGSGRVTSVNLSDNNLSGTIPTEIGMLPHLQILALNNNHLTGNSTPDRRINQPSPFLSGWQQYQWLHTC